MRNFKRGLEVFKNLDYTANAALYAGVFIGAIMAVFIQEKRYEMLLVPFICMTVISIMLLLRQLRL